MTISPRQTKIAISIIALMLLLSCTHSTAITNPDEVPVQSDAVSIAYLKSLCNGKVYDITSDISISGTVIANDWLGEYQKSIVVIDQSGGIEIAIDKSDIFKEIPIYAGITVFCNGMALGRTGDKISLGAHPTGSFATDRLDGTLISRYIRIDTESGEDLKAERRILNSITAKDIGLYVRFDNVSVVVGEQGGSWCDCIDGDFVATVRHIVDASGGRFAIRTLASCRYAKETMPSGEFSVGGIVDSYGGELCLRVVNYKIVER